MIVGAVLLVVGIAIAAFSISGVGICGGVGLAAQSDIVDGATAVEHIPSNRQVFVVVNLPYLKKMVPEFAWTTGPIARSAPENTVSFDQSAWVVRSPDGTPEGSWAGAVELAVYETASPRTCWYALDVRQRFHPWVRIAGLLDPSVGSLYGSTQNPASCSSTTSGEGTIPRSGWSRSAPATGICTSSAVLGDSLFLRLRLEGAG
jgi:hypothetical protein